MDKYLAAIPRRLHRELLHDTTFTTGSSEHSTFTLSVKAFSVTYESGNKFIYWYVGCSDPFNPDIHPFRHSSKEDNYHLEPHHWEVIADNELTRSLLNHLCLPDSEIFVDNKLLCCIFKYLHLSNSEIGKDSGNTRSDDYRSLLIEFIDSFNLDNYIFEPHHWKSVCNDDDTEDLLTSKYSALSELELGRIFENKDLVEYRSLIIRFIENLWD